MRWRTRSSNLVLSTQYSVLCTLYSVLSEEPEQFQNCIRSTEAESPFVLLTKAEAMPNNRVPSPLRQGGVLIPRVLVISIPAIHLTKLQRDCYI